MKPSGVVEASRRTPNLWLVILNAVKDLLLLLPLALFLCLPSFAKRRICCLGNPGTYRLWVIGTHHLFGILSGPGPLPELDNESPQLPRNVDRLLSEDTSVFGDFEVCPLEPEVKGSMQMACIASAKNLVQKYATESPATPSQRNSSRLACEE